MKQFTYGLLLGTMLGALIVFYLVVQEHVIWM